MQKAFVTLDNQIVNENCISAFHFVNYGNDLIGIEIIPNFHCETLLIISIDEKEKQEQLMEKIDFMFLHGDWFQSIDGSLIRVDHILQTIISEEDDFHKIDIQLSNNRILNLFTGTQDGARDFFKKLKKSCYTVIYDLEKI